MQANIAGQIKQGCGAGNLALSGQKGQDTPIGFMQGLQDQIGHSALKPRFLGQGGEQMMGHHLKGLTR